MRTDGPSPRAPHPEIELVEQIQAVRGMNDVLPAQIGAWQHLERTVRELLSEFRDTGGDAIEVVSGSHTPAQYTEFARYARVFGMLASSGSDFHGPGESWADLGDMPPLPAGVTPVWKDW